jgi:hypothetical protein
MSDRLMAQRAEGVTAARAPGVPGKEVVRDWGAEGRGVRATRVVLSPGVEKSNAMPWAMQRLATHGSFSCGQYSTYCLGAVNDMACFYGRLRRAGCGGTGKCHRQHVRTFLNIRRASRNDRKQFATWLQEEVIPSDHALRAIQDMALTWFCDQRLAPPAESRLDRLIRSTLHQHETRLFTHIAARLSPHTKSGIDRLLISPEVAETETSDTPSGPLGFTNLKADPGRIGLNSLLKELAKHDQLRKLEPLLYNHVTPHGTFALDLAKRLPLDPMPAIHV